MTSRYTLRVTRGVTGRLTAVPRTGIAAWDTLRDLCARLDLAEGRS